MLMPKTCRLVALPALLCLSLTICCAVAWGQGMGPETYGMVGDMAMFGGGRISLNRRSDAIDIYTPEPATLLIMALGAASLLRGRGRRLTATR